MKEKSLKIFVDFDGTITKEDVGAGIFLHFGDYNKVMTIEQKISSLEISGSEGWEKLFNVLPQVDEQKLTEFVSGFQIDDTFKDFVSFTEKNFLDVFVLSDGFDFYIEKILRRENLSYLKFYSNNLEISRDGKMIPSFHYRDEECNKCANCKRNHILANSGEDEYTVYIGNGSSDVCPAQYCDFIFAKDTLLKYCEKERISYFPFDNFNDVKQKLENLLSKKRLKKRHQAEIKRKHVYQLG